METVNKEKNFISLVAYVHNNENEIDHFLNLLYSELNDHFDKFELIFVNDRSTDTTVEHIRTFSKTSMIPISVIQMSYYQGLELSMTAGVDLAIGDFVLEFDSVNINFDISLIMRIYQRCLDGYDIVSASPRNNLRFSSKIFYSIYNKNSNNINKLKTESFRVLSRRAINRIQSLVISIPYRKAVYANSGLKSDTIYYETNQKNEPVLDMRIKGWLAIDSLILFTNTTFKFSFFLTLLMMLGTLSIAIYTILIYISEKPVEGWTTTMLVITGGFFSIFFILTIIIKYLSLLLELVFRKHTYMIESIEKHGR